MAIINNDLYDLIQNRIAPFLTGSKAERIYGIVEFIILRTEKEIHGLLGYLNWASNQKPMPHNDVVRDTIQCDINNRLDETMAPRTESYAEHYPEYRQPSLPTSPAVECGSCNWTGLADDCADAKDILQRHNLGDIFSDIECPECSALVFPVNKD